jgi:hypothetical protein
MTPRAKHSRSFSRTEEASPTSGRINADAGQSKEPSSPARNQSGWLLVVASGLLLLLAAAQGYVSFRAQYAFVDHAKNARIPSILEALGLDTGAVIFALLALALASRGRPAVAERILNVACALGSLVMNLLAADLTSPRSIAVWVLPSALYALTSDRLIAVMRRWVHETDSKAQTGDKYSAWRTSAGLILWALRLGFAGQIPIVTRRASGWSWTRQARSPGCAAGCC